MTLPEVSKISKLKNVPISSISTVEKLESYISSTLGIGNIQVDFIDSGAIYFRIRPSIILPLPNLKLKCKYVNESDICRSNYRVGNKKHLHVSLDFLPSTSSPESQNQMMIMGRNFDASNGFVVNGRNLSISESIGSSSKTAATDEPTQPQKGTGCVC